MTLPPVSRQEEPSFQLLDDGYYWFLHPLFKDLANETGQYIDLYGDASFSGSDLAGLEEMLRLASKLIALQPTTWNVIVGYELVPYEKENHSRPHQKEKFATVDRALFQFSVSEWERVVTRAKELNRPVVCFGD